MVPESRHVLSAIQDGSHSLASVDLSRLTPVEHMAGEDEAETVLLQQLLVRAEEYLRSFHWCPPIAERYLGIGVGGVLAVFLFKLERAINNADELLWVVEGDLPSAYFVVDEAPNAKSALEVYCTMMEYWANAVMSDSSLDDVFPVAAPATKANADRLCSRIRFIRNRII